MKTLQRETRVAIAATAAVIFMTTLWLSSQRVAAELRYHPALGVPIADVAGAKIYAPWAWIGWAARFTNLEPSPFRAPALLSVGGFLVSALAFSIAANSSPRTSTAHGSARWATTKELKRAGLLTGRGVVLGQTADAVLRRKPGSEAAATLREGQVITHDGPEHAMIFAPTRSGKGVSVVLPTLFTWTGSVIAYDIKRELWEKTAGYRSRFSHCLRFEPCAHNTVRYNPLIEVRRGDHEVADVQNICDILVDPAGGKAERSHWDKTAASLMTGLILHVLYAEERKTLARVAELLSDPERPVVDVLESMLATMHLGDRVHPTVAAVAREMLNKEEREQSGVISSALALLTLYRDPIVAASTSESDFRIGDLMNSVHPVSLYIVVPPNDLSRTNPLVRLLLSQIGRRLTESMDHSRRTYNHRLLFLLDEFPTLGRLDFFESALAFVAGYGIKCLLVAQSLNQIAKAYGERNSILDNCHIRLAYAANDDMTSKRISDLLGQATHIKTQRSFRGSIFGKSQSTNEQEHPRALLTPGEVAQLPYDEATLLASGIPPYRLKKIFYYGDERFQTLDRLPAPNTPQAQAAELPPPKAHDWLRMHRPATRSAPSAIPPDGTERDLEAFDPSSPPPSPSGDIEAFLGFLPNVSPETGASDAAATDSEPPV